MIPFLMVWLYLGLLISAMQWPSVVGMLTTFVLLVVPPLFLLYRLLAAKRQQRQAAENETDKSVQVGVDEVDRQDAGNNQ